ncbi:uncharacterized protein LOC110454660 isoform X1 [Mizuhopecten yessoensis]|uniref:uncharacterized protein LOC110454660 isoform X1 n=1 Tax=Mizuhopecten yessoensis TaxID=6573 RepID=UPI000B45A708|nr:uncharacterized protein LOC110454660 isoform X1 [Mizuhopecten yessoensis]
MVYQSVEKKASEAGIVDPTEIAQAIQFLHDLGSVQYFPTEHLKGHVVINPQWIVDVMACVVSIKQEGITDGRLMHSDLDAVWSEYHTMASWLLRLTEEFDLTFQLEGESCNIVPCLLPEKWPDFEWPDIIKDEGIYEMKLVYKFDYLPSGLFNRAQVRLHGYSEDSMIWKRGSFIEKNGQLALIQQDGESELSVRVQGPNPSNMLFFIHEVFEGLINESFQGVTYDYEIPCPDCTKHYQKDPHMFKASSIRRALELRAPFLQCQKQFHTASILSLQAILAPDTNSDYEVHLDQDVNSLLQMQKEMATDIFISYCSRDAPKDRSEVIHPADIYADLEKEGFSCYFPEGGALYSREEMAQQLVHSSVFLVLISNSYAADEVCCDMYKYAVSTMKRPTICVAVGENFDWKKSPSLGVIMSDVVFVNMINSKKPVYETKLKELLSTLQKHEQISQVKPETFGSCFISYSWANSRLAVECGTKELPGALGFGDPRHIKDYLEEKGIKCWLDIDQVSVNDQLLNRIAQGLSEARVVVVCVSDQYAQSKMCCKEMRFAIQLELPVVVAIVGSGKQWKRSEVGFNSMSYPAVDFQRPNPNACEDLLTLIKSEILPERVEVTDRRKRKDQSHSDRANNSFKEMYELAQRKFLRQISNYAVTHDMASYPRLFVVDIVDNKSPEVKNTLPNEDEFKSRKYCVHTLCECEQGWHSVCKPLELEEDFTGEDLEEYASYLAHVTLVMKHSPDIVLNLFSDVDGQQYLNYIQELTLKGGNNFETSYQQLRQKVFEMDSNSEKGKLKRCRLPTGKIIWLCKEHIAKLKVTVLSENVTEVQQKSTNQVWVEAMMEALRLSQNLPFTFKPTALQSRTFNNTAEDVAEVERHTKMTLSRTASTLDKAAIIQAAQAVQGSDSQKKKKEKKPKKERRKKPPKEDGEKPQIEDGEKPQIEDGEKPQIEEGEKHQIEEGEKHQKKGRRGNKKSNNEDTSEIPLGVTSQETPTEVDVDSVEKGHMELPPVQQDSVETQEVATGGSPTRIGGDTLAAIAVPMTTLDSSLGEETVEQPKDLTAPDSPSNNENENAHKYSHQDSTVASISQVNSVPNTPTPTSPVPPTNKHRDTEENKDSLYQDKAVSKTCMIL